MRYTYRDRGHWLTSFALAACLASAAARGESPVPYQRVIATAPSNAEILCALDLCDHLVGVSQYVHYPPALEAVPRIGGLIDPNLERIVALNPDLVVIRGGMPSLKALCQREGIRVYRDRTDSLPSILETIRELGDLFDRADAATALAGRLTRDLDAVRKRASRRRRVRTLLTVGRNHDRLAEVTTAGKPSYLHAVLDLAGGANVFEGIDAAYPTVSLEAILARQPEVIIEIMPGGQLTPSRQADLASHWRQLAPLEAGRAGRIHYLVDDYALIPSPRVVLLAAKFDALLAREVDRDQP